MEKDYKKFSIYDILMLVVFAAGLIAYSYKGEKNFLILACLIALIFSCLQKQILKPYDIDYNNLIPKLQRFLLLFVVIISTTFSNYYNWAAWIGVLALVIMFYMTNKAIKEKLLTKPS